MIVKVNTMRVNLNSVMGIILLIKNFLIILLLMVIFPLETEELGRTARLFFVTGVGIIAVGLSCAEMRLLDWIVRKARKAKRG
ncbi:putative TMhelix containing protein [Vibrio phage 409E50-1]|nr:putative TMhelix containing protein [Vibrio phage 521E56-1]CAH9013040.1 putative TMhelix containing protein [Vibrio phage 384E50-1]CAH9013080.1 putative TMhelix containing protein [Vibrio phage 409E50-1]CAH9013110.1 putative TMhelix containing protein [Vibrio phage 402E50-1]CAH9013825.1 putative TMhelix containing protein [Vibrio phage 405E50-1]CAH9013878.1 putative TMhelix containing protein [Vibrio phage 413E50-1]